MTDNSVTFGQDEAAEVAWTEGRATLVKRLQKIKGMPLDDLDAVKKAVCEAIMDEAAEVDQVLIGGYDCAFHPDELDQHCMACRAASDLNMHGLKVECGLLSAMDMEAENERIRDALELIANSCGPTDIEGARLIARYGLGGKDRDGYDFAAHDNGPCPDCVDGLHPFPGAAPTGGYICSQHIMFGPQADCPGCQIVKAASDRMQGGG